MNATEDPKPEVRHYSFLPQTGAATNIAPAASRSVILNSYLEGTKVWKPFFVKPPVPTDQSNFTSSLY
jgi:hypothetical protein